MKRLSRDLRILTPFLAGGFVLLASVSLYLQDRQQLDAAITAQTRLLHLRTELQQARRLLLETTPPDTGAARPHLNAVADLVAGDAGAVAHAQALRQGGDGARRHLDALLASAASSEDRAASRLEQARQRAWQHLWLVLGLGAVLLMAVATLLLREVRTRHRLGDRLQFEATHDSLTGLPNRRYFMQWTQRMLAQARRDRAQLALLHVDLEGLRRVNEQEGQEFGDRLLRVAAQRFRDRVRESDVLARIGGDRFVVLTQVTGEVESVAVLAERLLGALRSPLLPQFGDRYPVGASIGIAVFPRDALTPDNLLQAAGGATRAAREAGGNVYRFAADLPGPAAAP